MFGLTELSKNIRLCHGFGPLQVCHLISYNNIFVLSFPIWTVPLRIFFFSEGLNLLLICLPLRVALCRLAYQGGVEDTTNDSTISVYC